MGEPATQLLDLSGIAEAVDDQIGALRAERFRDAESDTTGRACDQRRFSFELHSSPRCERSLPQVADLFPIAPPVPSPSHCVVD